MGIGLGYFLFKKPKVDLEKYVDKNVAIELEEKNHLLIDEISSIKSDQDALNVENEKCKE